MKEFVFATLFLLTAAICCYQISVVIKSGYNEPGVAAGKNAMLIGQKRPLPVLIVDGFSNHDWKQTTAITKRILEGSGLFTVSVSTIPTDIIQRSRWAPKFSDYAERSLENYVRAGGGLYILHSANNAFSHWNEYDKMIGLGWRPVTTGYALEIDSKRNILRIPPGVGMDTGHSDRFNAIIKILNRHPINEHYPDEWQTANTEVYYFARGPAQNLTVLSYALDSTGTQRMWPVEWIVRYGKGRVYNSSMGHLWQGEIYPPAYRCVGYQTTVIRATQWLATGKVSYPIPHNFPTRSSQSLKNENEFIDLRKP